MVHINANYVKDDGSLDLAAARGAKDGFAILSILFYVDNSLNQNHGPLATIVEKVWDFHDSGAHSKQAFDLDTKDAKKQAIKRDQLTNLRRLESGFSQLKANESAQETRSSLMKKIPVTVTLGVFIRRVTRIGMANINTSYWTYKGSFTTPPCNEAVTWVVFKKTLPITQIQANAFSSLYCDNWRPTRKVSSQHNVQHYLHTTLA